MLAGIPTLGLPQRRIAFGAQNPKLVFERTRAAFEIGELDGLLVVARRRRRRAAIRVAAGGMLPLGARRCALALAFVTAPIGGAATHRWLALKAGRRPAVALNMQAPRILMDDPPRRAPFELARGRRVIDVSCRAHVAFNATRRAVLQRLRFSDRRSERNRRRNTRPIPRARSRITAALGDRAADDRPIGAMDTDILRDNHAFRSGSGGYGRGSHSFRKGSGADRSGSNAF
jgi:hypothetical protein